MQGERTWTLRKEGRTRHGELRDRGNVGAGVEFQIHAYGSMLYGRRFQSGAAALLMSEQERKRYQGLGRAAPAAGAEGLA